MNLVKTAIFLILASVTVMFTNGLFTHKVQIADLIFLAVFVPVAIKFISAGKEIYLSPFIKPISVYLLAAGLSIFVSVSARTTALEFAGTFYLVLLFLLWINIVDTKKMLYYAVWCWVAISVAVGLVGLYGIILAYGFNINNPFVTLFAKHPYINNLYRVHSTFFQNEKFFSSYLLISIPFTLGLAFSEKKKGIKVFLYAALALFLINVFFTYSRSLVGILCAVYIVICRSSGYFASGKGPLVKALKAGGAVLILAVWIVMTIFSYIQFIDISARTTKLFELPEEMEEPFYYRNDIGIERADITVYYNYTYYFLLKKYALKIFAERPLFGVGGGAFIDKMKIYEDEGRAPKGYFLYDPHSTFFGSLAEGGMIGFGVLLFLWGSIIFSIKDRIRDRKDDFIFYTLVAGYAAIIGYFVQAIDMDIMNFRFLWLLFGFAAAALRLCRPQGVK
ncbi:MAG: O-antigen ligase family protein [Candidatus Omnitrophota bacterium]